MSEQDNITNSLARTKWNCEYHIVFVPKYRRQIIYGKIKMGKANNIKVNMCVSKYHENDLTHK